MQGTPASSSSHVALTTPTRSTARHVAAMPGSAQRPIQLSPCAQHISPLGASPPRFSPPRSNALRIRRHGLDSARSMPTKQELCRLFAAVRDDDAQAVSNGLKGLSDPHVKDPNTGETLALAAAAAG